MRGGGGPDVSEPGPRPELNAQTKRTPLTTGAASGHASVDLGEARVGEGAEPIQRRAQKLLQPSRGRGRGSLPACFISGSVCICTDRNCGLPSMFPGEISGCRSPGLNGGILLLVSSMRPLSRTAVRAARCDGSRCFSTSAAHQNPGEPSPPRTN